MTDSVHPLALDPNAVRLREHSLIQVEELLEADSFSLDGDIVVFRRRARGDIPAVSWQGRIGDWLVLDGAAHWRIVSDEVLVFNQSVDPSVHQSVNQHT